MQLQLSLNEFKSTNNWGNIISLIKKKILQSQLNA